MLTFILCLGFRVLINKEFVWFGHRFRSRSGEDINEQSPIFLQFLDCVWQVWRQFPWEFEFSDKLLVVVLYSQSSRYTNDFLYEHFYDRVVNQDGWGVFVDNESFAPNVSIWDHITSNYGSYLNPLYAKAGLSAVVESIEKVDPRGTSVSSGGANEAGNEDYCVGDDESTVCYSNISEEDMLTDNVDNGGTESSVSGMISAAIQTELVNQKMSGSIAANTSLAKALVPPLDKFVNSSNQVDTQENNVSVSGTDPSRLIEEATAGLKTNISEGFTVSNAKSLLAMDWNAHQQGGSLVKHIDDPGLSFSTCSAPHSNTSPRLTTRKIDNEARTVRLILPETNLPSLALWEDAHMVSGIPFSNAHSGTSSSLERGLYNALKAERERVAILETQLTNATALLKEKNDLMKRLEGDLFRMNIEPADADTVIINSLEDISMSTLDPQSTNIGGVGWAWNSLSRSK